MVNTSLPWELESEILSRVPPTSAKRLQLTCKRWYALFKDQRFISKHLGKSEAQMVLLNDESVYSCSFNFHGIHNWYGRFIDCTRKLRSQKYSEAVKISEIFHCEGLLLCTTKDNSVVVWNPGQTRWVQSRLSSNCYTKYKYFLGYENKNKSCDSLKILKCGYDYQHIFSEFEIYEFNSDSWRVLDTNSVNLGTLSRACGVSLKGNTYWLVYGLGNFILRFDFTTERFGHDLSLPSQSDYYDAGVLSVVREEKLALLFQNSARYSQSEIWVTNTKADETKDFSWSEFSVKAFSMTRVMSFLVDEENKSVFLCRQDYEDPERTIIDVARGNICETVYKDCKETHYGRRRQRPSSLLLSYVPSLVQIPAKQSTPGGKRKDDFGDLTQTLAAHAVRGVDSSRGPPSPKC